MNNPACFTSTSSADLRTLDDAVWVHRRP
jgi:hypothetical protein